MIGVYYIIMDAVLLVRCVMTFIIITTVKPAYLELSGVAVGFLHFCHVY